MLEFKNVQLSELEQKNDLLERRLLNVIAQNRELRARIHVMQETVANIKSNHEKATPEQTSKRARDR